MDILYAAAAIILPPFLALTGCYRRKIIDTSLPWQLHYGTIAATLYFLLTMEIWVAELILSDAMSFAARKVLILAVLQALCYPVVSDFVKKYLHVTVELHETKHNHT